MGTNAAGRTTAKRERKQPPARIHLLAHANPLLPDVARMGYADLPSYLAAIRSNLPAEFDLTFEPKIFQAVEDTARGGRNDDAARIRDIQRAIDDPHTLAIVALNGGGYFTRLLPHIRFDVLRSRRDPLHMLGFSEMTTLVNIIASYHCGRGLYWLCPNYLGWKLRPAPRAQQAFAEFWRLLPAVLAGEKTTPEHLYFGPLEAELVRGRAPIGPALLIGGCLSVLAAMLTAPIARRLKPDKRWLLIEDIQEAVHRIDRHLAVLKLAGWFERIAGVIVGDFRFDGQDQRSAVVELLAHHLPAARRLPVAVSALFGHTWPMTPVPVNRSLVLRRRGRQLSFAERA